MNRYGDSRLLIIPGGRSLFFDRGVSLTHDGQLAVGFQELHSIEPPLTRRERNIIAQFMAARWEEWAVERGAW